MDKTSGKLTVFFEEPFWVGVFERVAAGKLQVCKVTFGAEPKDYEVWDFILKHYHELKFSPAVETEIKQTADNPKRRQRNARKQLQSPGIGTKSQQALQMQREEMKTERRQVSKEQRETEKQHQFELKQQKRKEKHRGH
jgi:sulfur relay (sulfurtransferase) DsrC/TusE family protein